MVSAVHSSELKVIGANGQISLGKKYAGRQVMVEEREPGVWTVRMAVVIPDSERWLHEAPAATDLQSSLEWAGRNPPSDDDLDRTLERLANGES